MPAHTACTDRKHEQKVHLLAGRILARPLPDRAVIISDGQRVLVVGPVSSLLPGDLVRIYAQRTVVPDCHCNSGNNPGDLGIPEWTASDVELVFRPTRAPLGPDTETGAFLAESLYQRLELRAKITDEIRGYFKKENFLEVQTPTIATSPGLDLHLHAFGVVHPNGAGTNPPDPWGYLITSPEYHMKRMLAGGVTRCFQLAKCFRANEIGTRHEPEFTMLEWYRAWACMDDVIADTEQVIRAAARAALTEARLHLGNAQVSLEQPFRRMTVREAFEQYAPDQGDPIELARANEHGFFSAMVDRIEPNLGLGQPTFLTHFPASQASLARLSQTDPSVCERFELYVHGIELCNGFVELTDPIEQRARLERDQRERARRGLPVYPIDERFLHALEEGMPPAVGNALGLDRLIALASGRSAIRDVMAFPHRRR